MLNWGGSSATCDDSKSGIFCCCNFSVFDCGVAGYQAGDELLSVGLMNCLYTVMRVVNSLLKLLSDSVRMMFNFLFAVMVMFWMYF